MKKILLATLLAFSCLVSAQKKTCNIYFKKNQLQLGPEQEKQLRDIAGKTKDEELVTIFPLTYDSINEQYIFAKVADKQAAEIARFARTIGFRVLSTPSNFPCGFKGRSYSVNLRLITHVIVEVKTTHFTPKASQFFLIDPNRDTIIMGNEGTKLHFPAGCLLAKSKVMVELKEYYAMADYIKNELPSVSNGKMIESGGVIYLNAKTAVSKKQVNINPDKGIGAEFTLGKNKPKMQVFIKDPSSNNMNWVSQDSFKRRQIWTMTETIYDHEDNIISQITYHSKEEWAKHLKEEEEKEKKYLKELEEEKKEMEKREKLQKKAQANKDKSNKMLQLYNFGFINCDRFIDEPQKPFMVKLDETNENTTANYYLVFNDIRGVMTGYTSDKELSFGSVPVNKQATLIAISFEGSQAYYFSSAVTTGNKSNLKISLKPVDEKFINGELAKLK